MLRLCEDCCVEWFETKDESKFLCNNCLADAKVCAQKEMEASYAPTEQIEQPVFPTSAKLEAIVAGFRLHLCEVVSGSFEDGSPAFRFNFMFAAKSDEGNRMVDSSCQFPATPREFAMTLRRLADELDAYWARAFPEAVCDTPRDDGERVEIFPDLAGEG